MLGVSDEGALFLWVLQAFQVKGGRVFLFCTAFLLHETVGETKLQCGVHHTVVFVGGYAAVQAGIAAAAVIGRVLAQEADQVLVLGQVLFYPVQKCNGIILMAGKDHVADDDAFLHEGRV